MDRSILAFVLLLVAGFMEVTSNEIEEAILKDAYIASIAHGTDFEDEVLTRTLSPNIIGSVVSAKGVIMSGLFSLFGDVVEETMEGRSTNMMGPQYMGPVPYYSPPPYNMPMPPQNMMGYAPYPQPMPYPQTPMYRQYGYDQFGNIRMF